MATSSDSTLLLAKLREAVEAKAWAQAQRKGAVNRALIKEVAAGSRSAEDRVEIEVVEGEALKRRDETRER